MSKYATLLEITCHGSIYKLSILQKNSEPVHETLVLITHCPASLIPAQPHTFVEIDHEMISTVILLPSAESFKKGCCQLQAKVCA